MRFPVFGAVALITVACGTPAAAQANRDAMRVYDQQADDWRLNDRPPTAWRQFSRYDFNRPEPGESGYFADRYYRRSRGDRPVVLASNDRIYRGRDALYYCRRSDGTTGRVIGVPFGDALRPGGSRVIGTLEGGNPGLRRTVDAGQAICR